MKKRGFKILSVLISAVFLLSAVGWSAPQDAAGIFSLRARSAFERNGSIGARIISDLLAAAQDPDRRAAYKEILGIRGVTPQQVAGQVELMRRERHAPQPIGEYAGFPKPQGASSSPDDNANRQRLIAAGKTKEALNRLAILISGGGEGSRLLTELENKGLITKEEKRELTKVTLPVSPVMGFSTLAIQLKIIANICRKFEVDIPVCVAMSPLESNQPLLEKFLAENDNFGIHTLIKVVQDVNTTYMADQEKIVIKADGSVAFNPNGQGGILRAMAKDGQIKRFREAMKAKGVKPEYARLLHFNGDNVIDEDLIYLAAGAAARNPSKKCVNFTYAYPKGMKFGVLCFVKKPDGNIKLENVEYNERAKVSGLETACRENEAAGKLRCNGNILIFSLDEGLERRIADLAEHAQLSKVTDGVTGNTDKAEYFLPDMMAQYDQDEVLLVTVDPFPGIKNPQALAEIKDGLVKSNLEMARRLGIEVEAGCAVEFAPGFDISKARIGRNVRISDGARVYFGGDDLEVGDNVNFAGGTVIVDRRLFPSPVFNAAAARETLVAI